MWMSSGANSTVAAYVVNPGAYPLEDEEVQLRENHAGFRMGAGQRLQRASTHNSGRPAGGFMPPGSPQAAAGAAAAAAGGGGPGATAAANSKKTRRRWLEDGDDSLGGGDDFIPVGRQDQIVANTGHIVRMRRGEAWSKFLAYEGCCQVRSLGAHWLQQTNNIQRCGQQGLLHPIAARTRSNCCRHTPACSCG